MAEFGRLERVALREYWAHEALNFTPWLAREENIALLADTIGLELEVEAQEQPVGPFSADILCKETASDHWVLIENQIARTDHTHLGQLLTYAAGLDAVTIIWIAERFTDEHRAALNWLNQITGEQFRFFGLEIELWKIGDSPVAPKFNLISKPNNWSKAVATGTRSIQDAPLTSVKQLQLAYWTAFREYMLSLNNGIQPQKAAPQHWMNISIGVSPSYIAVTVNSEKKLIGLALLIGGANRVAVFRRLLEEKAAVEAEIGTVLTWRETPEHRESKITLDRPSSDFTNRTNWPALHAWHADLLLKFKNTLGPRLRELKTLDPLPPPISSSEPSDDANDDPDT